jgi:hypothetical protein
MPSLVASTPEPIESVGAVSVGAMSVEDASVEAPRLRKHDEAEAFEAHGAASASEDAHGGRRSGRSGGVERRERGADSVSSVPMPRAIENTFRESGAESAGTHAHAANVGVGIGLVERFFFLCCPVSLCCLS